MTGRQDELAHEQAVVDELYARLDELRSRARGRLRAVRREGPSGSPQNRSERDAFATLYEDRAAQLDAVEDRLAFGRLDLDEGTVRYVGRIGLTDDEQRSMLTDWRAPAAEAFYRATALRPAGVRRRRHLVTAGRKVTGVEDELLDLTGADDGDLDASSLSGEGALLAALATRRTGRMSDIVATIQAEQDRIIRSDLAGALVVQGGPGTGKTAVALHRAAYLLYAHRRTLEKAGVLLVGPSRSFLRYIDQVLPSLGETGVVSTTLGDLIPGITATAVDEGEAAEIKGRLLWADVVRRAVRARERVPEREVRFRLDGHSLVIRPRDVRDAIARARRTHKPHNEARTGFVRDMLARLAEQYQRADGGTLTPEDRAVVLEDLRSLREVRVALNLAWFPISPKKLVDDLLSRPHRLAEAAPELTAAERAAVLRAPWAPWTESDVPLLDEAAELLGEDDAVARAEQQSRAAERAEALAHARSVIASGAAAGAMIPVDAETLAERFATTGPRLTTAERAAADRAWTYGHVVVDEAQELSPMAWRMLARRVPTRSMTIVGDVAQTSSRAGARSWSAALTPVLGSGWRLEELTVSYRTPAEVADAAQRIAKAAGLPASPLTAAREVPGAIVDVPVADAAEVAARVAERAVALATELVGPDGAGRIAVVASDPAVAALRQAVGAALPAALGEAEAARLADQRREDEQVTVLAPRDVKGLEYDAVVLVEPTDIAHGPGGWSDLYVAMTRPTQRLVVVRATPLPDGFTG
ncbi:Superfamily I DNA and RNA helicase-like protein [Xylanimonas cellulosilytica DSM 15894]|uniref:Superfamily I DNA and RNA helicase-like protein n=1 Tax=Xylanimonas cellulosilytica (strain DSM 15894 / JCM 12276 / CECT 5975 / KCTC 9989 / LMG 20990 / NBRC 107835 / XIL07) TaxID=446471 RepID=D1C0A4_XYLCX|nr:AAA family ATPase [Xylanimonas cellulosilytica]ACZ30293.1 Superfamily I DNA and RNA helicase-like protein [Xylanimonas cellulosilytica DSM 15894]